MTIETVCRGSEVQKEQLKLMKSSENLRSNDINLTAKVWHFAVTRYKTYDWYKKNGLENLLTFLKDWCILRYDTITDSWVAECEEECVKAWGLYPKMAVTSLTWKLQNLGLFTIRKKKLAYK